MIRLHIYDLYRVTVYATLDMVGYESNKIQKYDILN